jgi:hypothetical protein
VQPQPSQHTPCAEEELPTHAEQSMTYPIKSATVLMLLSFSGGIYVAMEDIVSSQQATPGNLSRCLAEPVEPILGSQTVPCGSAPPSPAIAVP